MSLDIGLVLDKAYAHFERQEFQAVIRLLEGADGKRSPWPVGLTTHKQAAKATKLLMLCHRNLGNTAQALSFSEQVFGFVALAVSTTGSMSKPCLAHFTDACLSACQLGRAPQVESMLRALLADEHPPACVIPLHAVKLALLGFTLRLQKKYGEALVELKRSEEMLAGFPKELIMSDVIANIAICCFEMDMYVEAGAACLRSIELCEQQFGPEHLETADGLWLYGKFLYGLKQYEGAVNYFRRFIDIKNRHDTAEEKMFSSVNLLLQAVKYSMIRNREEISVPHNWRMCNACGTIARDMSRCRCTRAYYCNDECALADWPEHFKKCDACWDCRTFLPGKIMRCSVCKVAKYCGKECSKNHWAEHKPDCRKP